MYVCSKKKLNQSNVWLGLYLQRPSPLHFLIFLVFPNDVSVKCTQKNSRSHGQTVPHLDLKMPGLF